MLKVLKTNEPFWFFISGNLQIGPVMVLRYFILSHGMFLSYFSLPFEYKAASHYNNERYGSGTLYYSPVFRCYNLEK